MSNNKFLISLVGFVIQVERNRADSGCLNDDCWKGIKQGTDGYPKKVENRNYLIGGG